MKEIKLLDHGYLKLVLTYGSDEEVIRDARMSTDKGFLGWDPYCPSSAHDENCKHPECHRGDLKLLAYLYTHKHMTPFEGSGLKFEIKAPIMVFREWHRHRTQSYNEMSGRYIEIPNEHYVPSVERLIAAAEYAQHTKNKQAQANAPYLPATGFTEQWAIKMQRSIIETQQIAQNNYQGLLECGVPKELARINMPVSRYSRMRATANLRNWIAFLTLREDPSAQWEIRQYAHAVASVIGENFPRTYELYLNNR